MSEKKSFYNILYPIVFLAALGLDRWTKQLAVQELSDGKVIDVIDGIFQFTYLENGGAAFGIMQGKQLLFYIITVIVCAVLIYMLIKLPKTDRYCPLALVMVFILAGAIGNFIDRVTQSYVVDFIYFVPINFPVFNVADIYVTLGCIALVILLLFVYKDNELDFLKPGKSEDEPVKDSEKEDEA